MLTATLTTPQEGRTDLDKATDSELFIEYAFFADAQLEYFEEGNARSDAFGRREDSYAKEIKAHIWDRGYDAALAAAKSHPTVHSNDEAEAVADAAVAEMLELGAAWKYASKCATGHTIAGMAAKAAKSERALKQAHDGTYAKERGTNQHTAAPKPTTDDEKAQARANRRIYATDPHGHGFDSIRNISSDGVSYDMDFTAVDEAIDAQLHGYLTANEHVIEWVIEEVTSATSVSRAEVLTWLHTTGLTNEVEEYIDLVAELGSHEEAARLADQRRFPLKDIAALDGSSLATVKRRIKTARDATYSDCTLTGVLRSGIDGTRQAEVNTKTLAFALTTSLEAHAKQSGQTLTKALVSAVPDAFFADYIAEYRADGSTAADIDPALVAEMRAAVEEVAA